MTHQINARTPLTPGHRTAITGTVIGVRDYGSLVILFLEGGDGRVSPVPVGRKACGPLLEQEGASLDRLIGCRVAFDGNLVSLSEVESPGGRGHFPRSET